MEFPLPYSMKTTPLLAAFSIACLASSCTSNNISTSQTPPKPSTQVLSQEVIKIEGKNYLETHVETTEIR
jgi:hypothetical protein